MKKFILNLSIIYYMIFFLNVNVVNANVLENIKFQAMKEFQMVQLNCSLKFLLMKQ